MDRRQFLAATALIPFATNVKTQPNQPIEDYSVQSGFKPLDDIIKFEPGPDKQRPWRCEEGCPIQGSGRIREHEPRRA